MDSEEKGEKENICFRDVVLEKNLGLHELLMRMH